jgi:hypothetical protein
MLGATPDAANDRISLQPYLPQSISRLAVERLTVNNKPVSLHVQRSGTGDSNKVEVGLNPANIKVSVP